MSHPQSTFTQTQFHGPSVLRARRRTFARVGARAQLRQLRETGRYDCFDLEWQPVYDEHRTKWPCPAPVFWDSDVAKWIEGACYLLADAYDPAVDAAVRELALLIRDAQHDDGYLNVYFSVVKPGERWTNIRDQHELYNAGHLIEAAIAHRQYYKTDLLIDVVERYVRHIRTVIGPEEGKLHAYPGHPEIELALLRLHAETGSQDAYELARYFIEERGNPHGQDGLHFYEWEARRRREAPWKRPDAYPTAHAYWYCQSHAPILEQQTIEGHAVRAMYLLTGVANLLHFDEAGIRAFDDDDGNQAKEKKSKYFEAVTRLWDNMVDKKMYLTGGIGAMWGWEGFGIDYFLPQGTDEGGCYGETCASIGVILLAERLLHLDLDARYADVLELCLYNNVMTSNSLDGAAFTYVNQLASSDAQPSRREDWFEVSCCPPNLLRLFGSLGGYLWDYGTVSSKEEQEEEEVYVNVHLYTTAVVTFETPKSRTVSLEQRSNWPWNGTVSFTLNAPAGVNTTIRLRIPGWSKGEYTLNPPAPSGTKPHKGYLTLPASYTTTTSSAQGGSPAAFTLRVGGFRPRHVAPHPYTGQRTVALARGPLVYCAEDVDNPWAPPHFRDVVLDPSSPVREDPSARIAVPAPVPRCGVWRRVGEDGRVVKGEVEEEEGMDKEEGEVPLAEERYVALRCDAWVRDLDAWHDKDPGAQPGLDLNVQDQGGRSRAPGPEEKHELVLIPYYLRANRGGKGHMRVGMLRK